jgi:hypothetical protein
VRVGVGVGVGGVYGGRPGKLPKGLPQSNLITNLSEPATLNFREGALLPGSGQKASSLATPFI